MLAGRQEDWSGFARWLHRHRTNFNLNRARSLLHSSRTAAEQNRVDLGRRRSPYPYQSCTPYAVVQPCQLNRIVNPFVSLIRCVQNNAET
jgi:hypothetical protein